MARQTFELQCGNATIELGAKTCIMGILNTTPDSFSDGGKFLDPLLALDRADEMIAQGADIIDIGGESSRPKGPYGDGAAPITTHEEIMRTLPVIEKLAAKVSVPISIDTTKSEVAESALNAGASIVNDISALRFDNRMAEIVANHNAVVVLMHMQGTPQTMQEDPTYENVTKEVINFLKEQIDMACAKGIQHNKIIVDPGFGFGKRFKHNIQLLAEFQELQVLGCPILSGPSRKQFTAPQTPPETRVPGTLAAITQSILSGAHIVRIHDVWQTRQTTDLVDAVLEQRSTL